MHALSRWLWTHGPGNPMIVRIVQGGSRRAHHLWVRMAYLGALVALVLLGLLSGGGLAEQASLGDLAKAGTWIFAVVAYGQVVLVCLLAPLFMAGAIGQEQAGKTLDILLTTPMTNLQIVLGSLLGRLFFILALLLSGLPLFAVLLFFGGVPFQSVLVAFAVAALTALLVGAVAVTLSVFRAGGRKAVFTFVIAIAAYLIGGYLLDVGLVRQLPGFTAMANATTWLTPLHPLLVMEASLNTANYRPPTGEYLAGLPGWLQFYLGRPFASFALWTAGLSLLLTCVSAVAIRQLGQDLPWWKRLAERRRLPDTDTPARAGNQDHARRRPPREVWQNPVAWREANTRGQSLAALATRWTFAALALALGAGLLALYHFNLLPTVPTAGGRPMPGHEVLHAILMAVLLLEITVITLVAIYMSAGAVSREREDGTLDLVLTTPITPKHYIWGKLRGLVSFLSLLIAVPVLTLALASAYALVGDLLGWEQTRFLYSSVGPGGARVTAEPLILLPEAPVLLLLMLVPFVALCAMAGMSWSLKARGVLGAIVPTVAVIGVFAVIMALCGLRAAEQIALIGPIINAFSPATNLMMIVHPWEHVSGFAADQLTGRISLFVAALLAAGGYAAIVYAMLMNIVRNFDQTVRKLSGTG